MPTVICEACGVDFHWRNTRGSKIPQRCACGGKLVPAVFDPAACLAGGNKYVPRKPRTGPRGPMVVCPICHKRRRAKGGLLKTIDVPFRNRFTSSAYPAGTQVCSFHSLTYDLAPLEALPEDTNEGVRP